MNLWEFSKANPFVAVVGFVIFFTLLFFPILLIGLFLVGWLYETFFNKSKAKADNFPLRSTTKHHKPSRCVLPKGNRYMSANDKQAYLSSPKWKALRQQVLARDNNKCVVSGRTDNLHIHHISYKNLGDELLSDLVTLHADVHNHLHQLLGYDRNEIYSLDRYYAAINHSTSRKN